MNLNDSVLTGDYAIVHNVICQYVSTFATHGFTFKGITLRNSPVLQGYPIFHFQNERTNMKINITFFHAVEGLNGGFNASITKPVNHVINVEDYLKLHGRETLARFFSYRDPATDIRSFADTFMQMLCGLFDRDLKQILDGTYFEETPIDWQGYK